MRTRIVTLLACLMLIPFTATAADVVRRAAGNFPIATSVSVPANAEWTVLSGTLADVADPTAPAGSIERLGDTETQAASVLARIGKALEAAGLGFGDVVKMNVYLMADPRKGPGMDFDGLMRAYSKHFGTPAQPALPARTTVQVAGLPMPGALVEIEVIAAKVASRP
jgi:enamine deaminase RidA (YjgF/YER057c/UK114 family)